MKFKDGAYSSKPPTILTTGDVPGRRIDSKQDEPKHENQTVQRLSEQFRREGLELRELITIDLF